MHKKWIAHWMRNMTFKKQIEINLLKICNQFTHLEMQTLSQFSNIENMQKMVYLLRLAIENAIDEKILKRRLCNQSKVWWSKVLTNKREFMIYSKQQWKNFKIWSDWNLFKSSKNDYFNTIKKVKNKSWTNSLNNAKNK